MCGELMGVTAKRWADTLSESDYSFKIESFFDWFKFRYFQSRFSERSFQTQGMLGRLMCLISGAGR